MQAHHMSAPLLLSLVACDARIPGHVLPDAAQECRKRNNLTPAAG
jgi:hypothetical protein